LLFSPTTISLLQKQVLLQNDVNKSEFWVPMASKDA
jgi:hypothetical protein